MGDPRNDLEPSSPPRRPAAAAIGAASRSAGKSRDAPAAADRGATRGSLHAAGLARAKLVTMASAAIGPNGGAAVPGEPAADGASMGPRTVGAALREPPGQNLPLPTTQNSGGFASTLLSTAVSFISLAAALIIALYCIVPVQGLGWQVPIGWNFAKPFLAPLAGTGVAVLLACLFALVNKNFTRPDRVDPEIYGELRARVGTLDAILPTLCPETGPAICEHSNTIACRAGCAEARARRDFIVSELCSHGSRWVIGTGYIDMYRQLHAAEAALFLVAPSADVVASGLYDSLRLDGAQEMPNWKMLRSNLQRALPLVGGASVQLLTAAPAEVVAAQTSTAPPPSPQEQAMGRAVLRDVRHAIDEFRDGERAGIVRARNQLAWTGTMTAIAAFALLVLAVFRRVELAPFTNAIAYYIVGATVGLFNQLRVDSKRGSDKEDFGFHRARLMYTPVLSGLAAVGGVLVVSLLLEAAASGGMADTTRTISDTFDFGSSPQKLIIAAVFGLTPDLLINRLQQKADEYRAGLTNTTAAANGPVPSAS